MSFSSDDMFTASTIQTLINNSEKSQNEKKIDQEEDRIQPYFNDQLFNINMMSCFGTFNSSNMNVMNPFQKEMLNQLKQFSKIYSNPFIFDESNKNQSNYDEFDDIDDEPLDLSSKKPQKNPNFVDDDQISTNSLEFKEKSNSPDFNEAGSRVNKRNYTQHALNNAVTEILSGKLGTRRASVVYGIPRSTLRNKIYKLESINEMNNELKRKKIKQDESNSKCDYDNNDQAQNLKKNNSILPNLLSSSPTFPPTLVPQISQLSSLNFSDLLKQVENNTDNYASSSFNDNANDDNEKRPRSKRGQYRKYDKCALEKAVQSVKKGEMSVHRAGSFYGVPHSTLEYKVKERNLLRTKRKNVNNNNNNNNNSNINNND